jgi:hypothetical protein
MRDDDELNIERIAHELREPVRLNASLDARIMKAVRELPRHAQASLWARLTTPRKVTIMPLSWGMLAASVAVFAVLGAAHAYQDVHRAAAPIAKALFPASTKPQQSPRVQFVLVAPDAKKVAVVGDFNGWDASHADFQAQHTGGGVWSVTASVPVGHHRYSFVIDDSVWVADPIAPRAADNDFGVPNSAIVVQSQE